MLSGKRYFGDFQKYVVANLDDSAVTGAQLERWRDVVKDDGFSLGAVDRAELSDAQKAAVAMLASMHLEPPKIANAARRASNLAEYFNEVDSCLRSLKLLEESTDPFEYWNEPGVVRVEDGCVYLFPPDLDGRYSFPFNGEDVDIEMALIWNPKALEMAISYFEAEPEACEEPLKRLMLQESTDIERQARARTAEALRRLRDEKLEKEKEIAKVLEAGRGVEPCARQDQADIDFIGATLGRIGVTKTLPSADTVDENSVASTGNGEPFFLSQRLQDFKREAEAMLCSISENEAQAIEDSIRLLVSLERPVVTNFLAHQAGLNKRSFTLLTVFRAMHQCSLHEDVQRELKLLSVEEAARKLLATSVFDDALKRLLMESSIGAVREGLELVTGHPASVYLDIDTVVQVQALPRGWEISQQGLDPNTRHRWYVGADALSSERNADTHRFEDLSSHALSTLVQVLWRVHSETTSSSLGYLRRLAHEDGPGDSVLPGLTTLLKKLCTLLREKIDLGTEEDRAYVCEALGPLQGL